MSAQEGADAWGVVHGDNPAARGGGRRPRDRAPAGRREAPGGLLGDSRGACRPRMETVPPQRDKCHWGGHSLSAPAVTTHVTCLSPCGCLPPEHALQWFWPRSRVGVMEVCRHTDGLACPRPSASLSLHCRQFPGNAGVQVWGPTLRTSTQAPGTVQGLLSLSMGPNIQPWLHTGRAEGAF